jgi:hypothetical protein
MVGTPFPNVQHPFQIKVRRDEPLELYITTKRTTYFPDFFVFGFALTTVFFISFFGAGFFTFGAAFFGAGFATGFFLSFATFFGLGAFGGGVSLTGAVLI